MSPLIWQIPLAVWVLSAWASVLTMGDYGRTVTFRSELHDTVSMIAMLPILIVILICWWPVALTGAAVRRFRTPR